MAKKTKAKPGSFPTDPPAYKELAKNKYVSRKPIVLTDDDIPICNCTAEEGCGDTCLNRLTLTECSERCPCGEKCSNRALQQSRTAKTRSEYMGKKGWGLVADEDIQEGQLIAEYTGEVLDVKKAEDRAKKYHEQGLEHTFIMTLSTHEVIDATVYGSVARLINHGCEPNCRSSKWMVNGETRVGIFAIKNVPKDTELVYRYNLEWNGGKLVRCRCGAPTCMGYLGADSQTYHKYPIARANAVAEAAAEDSATETEGSADEMSPGQFVMKENGKLVPRKSKSKIAKPRPALLPKTSSLPFPKARPSSGTDVLDPLDSDEEGPAWRSTPSVLQLEAREVRAQLALPTTLSRTRQALIEELLAEELGSDNPAVKRRRYQRSIRRARQLLGIRERLLVQTATLRRAGLTVASGRVQKDTYGFLHQVGQHDNFDSDLDMYGAPLGVKLTRRHTDVAPDPHKPLVPAQAPRRIQALPKTPRVIADITTSLPRPDRQQSGQVSAGTASVSAATTGVLATGQSTGVAAAMPGGLHSMGGMLGTAAAHTAWQPGSYAGTASAGAAAGATSAPSMLASALLGVMPTASMYGAAAAVSQQAAAARPYTGVMGAAGQAAVPSTAAAGGTAAVTGYQGFMDAAQPASQGASMVNTSAGDLALQKQHDGSFGDAGLLSQQGSAAVQQPVPHMARQSAGMDMHERPSALDLTVQAAAGAEVASHGGVAVVDRGNSAAMADDQTQGGTGTVNQVASASAAIAASQPSGAAVAAQPDQAVQYAWQQPVQQPKQVPLWLPQQSQQEGHHPDNMGNAGAGSAKDTGYAAAVTAWPSTRVMPWQPQQQAQQPVMWAPDYTVASGQAVAGQQQQQQKQQMYAGYGSGSGWLAPAQEAVQPAEQEAAAAAQGNAFDWGKELGMAAGRQQQHSTRTDINGTKYRAPWDMGA